MHQARGEFLAAARFAGNVDRRLTACQLADQCPHLLHGPGVASQRMQWITGLLAVRNTQCRLHQGAQLLEPDWFGKVVKSTGLERRDGILGAAVGGNHRNRCPGVLLGNVADDFQPIAVRQTHVGQAELKIPFFQASPRLGDAAGTRCGKPHPRQGQVDQLADVRLVIDDQHPVQFSARAAFASGNGHVSLLPERTK